MSLRGLTKDLKTEGAEAGRRQERRATGSVEAPEPEVKPAARMVQDGQAAIFRPRRTHKEASEPELKEPPEPASAPEVRVEKASGVRGRQTEVRWTVPGGIAARFGRLSERVPEIETPAEAVSVVPDASAEPAPVEEAPEKPLNVELDLQLHDFILRRQAGARKDEHLVENVELIFYDEGEALPVAHFPGWPEPLHVSPTAGVYPEPEERWVCVVDAQGLVYPVERLK